VDFFRKRYGSKFWDIIELKSPQAPFLVNAKSSHAHLSSDVRNAMDQARDYRDLIISDAEANKIINQPKNSRGRMMSKEKLVRLSKPYRFNNSLHYELIEKLDDCYFNNVILKK
jgi:hypothetical protein